MLNLKNRTEYSFRWAFGKIDDVLDTNQGEAAGMTDRYGCWGHVAWQKTCKKKGIKPIFGVELAVVNNMELREKQPPNFMTFLAVNNAGLKEIYDLVRLSTEKFYYIPRIDYSVLADISDNVFIFSGNMPQWNKLPKHTFIELNPASNKFAIEFARMNKMSVVATSDNFYPRIEHRPAYQMVVDKMNMQDRSTPMHILDKYQWLNFFDKSDESLLSEALLNTYEISKSCNVVLESAELVKPIVSQTLEEMCIEAAPRRGIDLTNQVYKDRLNRELELIAQKKFEDYFFVVSDVVRYAKQHMLVGPARGSSCGSLVCYLLDITDIDPIPYDLLFERFIDMNRLDLPDIDIDFPDDRRDMVFEYLSNKYGYECVTRLGTVSRFKAKSTITDISKYLRIPAYDVKELKDAIIERSGGDSRAAFCILDTFNSLEVGKATLAKYPELAVAADIEQHARHHGVHAAGILVTSKPITNYCAIDMHSGAAQLDKKDAEEINLLKIDALGLRTLSVIQDCLDTVGWSREQLLKYPLEDKAAFDVINRADFSGVFQFEGNALQLLCKQLKVEYFEDIVSITALARPGPLISGGTTEFLKRRTGQHEVKYMHPLTEKLTKVTYGIVVYQEQVMQIAREVGKLSWEDVSSLRKAMSKSLGKEFFDKYYERFEVGAIENGLDKETAHMIWDNINTMGSWAFNRSHAVAYGMLSYWCLVLKSKFPLEFAAACLRNAKDDEQTILILRELTQQGYKYKPYDKDLSEANWSVKDGLLIGGLKGIKGIGDKLAADILNKRAKGFPLTPRQLKLVTEGTTKYDVIFPVQHYFGHVVNNPPAYNIQSRLRTISEFDNDMEGEVVFIAQVRERNMRDVNELMSVQKRGGEIIEDGMNHFLNFTAEDDTGKIICTINRYDFEKLGRPLLEKAKEEDFFIFKGKIRRGFRKIYVKKWKKMTENPLYISKM